MLGGTVLGGGGGGWIEEGRKLGHLALERGFSEILSIDEIPEDAVLLTVSGVGAPSAGRDIVEPDDYIRAVALFIENSGLKIDGLISSEIGALGVFNGWLQSTAFEVPVIDAPCNGRAHPLGLMGSMGLAQQKEFISLQAAVGGSRERGSRVEVFFKGSLQDVAKSVREASIKAGGMVAVARNPVPARYVKEAGAPGAVAMAVNIGKTIMESRDVDPERALNRVLQSLGGSFYLRGWIEKIDLKTEGGLDIGNIWLKAEGMSCELSFWNEYMTLETEGYRIATFPDLIMTFDARSAEPLISAEIEEEKEVFVIAVPSEKLILGAGVRDMDLLRRVEETIGKEILKYRQLT